MHSVRHLNSTLKPKGPHFLKKPHFFFRRETFKSMIFFKKYVDNFWWCCVFDELRMACVTRRYHIYLYSLFCKCWFFVLCVSLNFVVWNTKIYTRMLVGFYIVYFIQSWFEILQNSNVIFFWISPSLWYGYIYF